MYTISPEMMERNVVLADCVVVVVVATVSIGWKYVDLRHFLADKTTATEMGLPTVGFDVITCII